MHQSEFPPITEQRNPAEHPMPADPERATRGATRAAEKERLTVRKQAAEKMVQELLDELSTNLGREAVLGDLGERGYEIEKRFRTVQEENNEGESIIAIGLLMKAVKNATPRTLH